MSLIGAFPVGSQPIGSGQVGGPQAPAIQAFLVDDITIIEIVIDGNSPSAFVLESLVTSDVSQADKIVARDVTDTLDIADDFQTSYIANLIEKISCTESFGLTWEGLSELKEQLDARDVLAVLLSDQITDSIDISDLWSHYGFVVALMDLMRVSGVTDDVLETQQLLAESLAFKDVVGFVLGADLLENVSLQDSFDLSLIAVNNQLDEILISEALTYSVTITAFVNEDMDVSEDLSSTAEMLRVLEDGLIVGAKLTNDTGVYEAWTMNTMTGGATLYDNFPFNSFALHTNNKYLGATDDGIYELAGADDDGTAIDAGFKTGLMDFGTTLSKRMVDAWFTMSADGRMLLKTTTQEDSGKIERWYEVQKTPRMHRAKMARGVKAMFWQFELTNIDGTEFDVDNMVLHPLPLNRRH